MKFIHLADVHLADNLNFKLDLSSLIRKKNKESFYKILEENQDADFILIAGDLYERDYFTLNDYKDLFEKIGAFKKDVFYVAGNHDYIGRDNYLYLKNKPDNLHIFWDDDLSYFEIDNIRVYGLSYVDRIYNKDFPYDIDLEDSYFNILLVHGDVYNKNSSYLNLDIGKLKNIGFDYVALGHIHKRDKLYDNIYYAGAIEPMDYSDLYDFGYIKYDEGKVSYVDSSLMKFYDLNIDPSDFNNQDDLFDCINSKLEDKINFLRLRTDKKISLNDLRKNVNAYDIDLKINEQIDYKKLASLYPNSILSKFLEKFEGKDDEMSSRALDLGLEALFRSQNDWLIYKGIKYKGLW